MKRNPMPWADWFLTFALVASQRSKDPDTQVGAVIVNASNHLVATGYNGFPPGVTETDLRWQRPTKYDFAVHAEENALMQAARRGVSVDGATMYCTLKPCKHCALLIASAGIRQLVYDKTATDAYDLRLPHNPHGFGLCDIILEEAGVIVTALGERK